MIGRQLPTLQLGGATVTGVRIGSTGDTCWDGTGLNFFYRADVTSVVRGNGSYTLSKLVSSTTLQTPDGQGASLVAIYVDAADRGLNYIGINDGAVGFLQFGVAGVATTMRGFSIGGGVAKATALNLVADGQQGGDELIVGGHSFGGGDAFTGKDGAMWDNRVDDVTAVVTQGATAVTQTVHETADCVAWTMSALVLENVAPAPAQATRASAANATKRAR